MIQRRYALITVFALLVGAASLSGCGSVNTESTSAGQSLAGNAQVTVAARFPAADSAVKSLIPSAAQVIEVYAMAQPYTPSPTNPNGTLLATLTPTEQSKTVQLAAGQYMILAIAYNSANVATRSVVGQASTGGEVLAGQANTIVLTFLNGKWTLVDANDTATPLSLSNGTLLNDFIITGDSKQSFKAGKSAIDFTKPFGGGGGMVRLRFNNNTGARTSGGMVSQFVGIANSILLGSDSYNLTKKCSSSNSSQTCDENAGDQLIMISSKETGGGDRGGSSEGILYGSAYELLPGKGQTTFTQNGAALDLMNLLPETTVAGGTTITGGIVEWKPSTNRSISLGTPAVAKQVTRTLASKAQSANTAYSNISVKNFETIVCSGTNPRNRGSWSFANNTSAGKVVLGGKVCYTNYPYLNSQYNPATMQYAPNSGDYSFGLVPANVSNLGDYCHQWDYDMYLPYNATTNPSYTTPNPNYNKACKQQLPGTGDIYQPYNFRAVKSSTKTTINYGSFKLNFWGETTQNGSAYVYPFRAKGSTTVTPAP